MPFVKNLKCYKKDCIYNMKWEGVWDCGGSDIPCAEIVNCGKYKKKEEQLPGFLEYIKEYPQPIRDILEIARELSVLTVRNDDGSAKQIEITDQVLVILEQAIKKISVGAKRNKPCSHGEAIEVWEMGKI